MPDQLERLRRLHSNLLGIAPQDEQDRLYRHFPQACGYSSKHRDDILFDAVLMLALLQAAKGHGESDLHKVYFLVPAPVEKWVLAQLKSEAKRIFDRLKLGKSVTAVKHVGALFHQVMLGTQVFALPSEPERWVAFGFSKSDPIPEWMSPKLLDFAEKSCEVIPGV